MKTILLLTAALALTVGAAEITQRQIATKALAGSGNTPASDPNPKPPPFTSPATMQAEFVRRFEASPGFGLSRVLRPVFLAPTPELVWNGASYRVVPPDLIGLEDTPIAYAPREHGHKFYAGTDTNLTRREVRKLFKNRPLTALETSAVLALREGRDLVVVTKQIVAPEGQFERLDIAPELLVLGALRAGRDCAACHQCEQGTLLGAFAYALTPCVAPLDGGTNSPAIRSNLVARLTGDPARPGGTILARSKL